VGVNPCRQDVVAIVTTPASGAFDRWRFNGRAPSAEHESTRSPGFAVWAICFLVVFAPTSLYILGRDGGAKVNYHAINLVDPLLMVFGIGHLVGAIKQWAIGRTRPALRPPIDRWNPILWLGLFCGWSAVSVLSSPSSMGWVHVVRLVGMFGIARTLARVPSSSTLIVVRASICAAGFQLVVSCAQLVFDRSIGLNGLGESADPFQRTAGWRVPTGTSFYPYPLVAMGLCAAGAAMWLADRLERRWVIFGVVCGGALLGLSGSLSGVVGFVVLVTACLFGRSSNRVARRSQRGLIVILVLVTLTSGLTQRSVWTWKQDRTTAADSGQASSGRGGQISTGLRVAMSEPIVGVGPMRFQESRVGAGIEPTADPQLTHSVPLLLLAELGVPGFLVAAAVAVALLRRNWRGTILLLGGISGYVAADIMHWYRGFGLIQLGFLIGLAAQPILKSDESVL
jgi:hypothetical protein